MSYIDVSTTNDPTDSKTFWSTDLLKPGLVGFWAAWLTIVTLSNAVDGLQAMRILSPEWTFASGNYELIKDVTSVHGTPPVLAGALYLGAILWEGLGAVLFWQATHSFREESNGLRVANRAFLVTLALFGTFILMSEVFIAYEIEATHMRIFIGLLASFLVVNHLPD